MSDEQLEAIRQRWQASTPGEWVTGAPDEDSVYAFRVVSVTGNYTDDDAELVTVIEDEADVELNDLVFIAAAHQDIPALLDVIRQKDVLIANQQDEMRRNDDAYWALESAFDALSKKCFQATRQIEEVQP